VTGFLVVDNGNVLSGSSVFYCLFIKALYSVGITNGTQAERPWNRASIPGRGTDLSLYLNVKTGYGAG
jgi:hypothetical protein